MAKRTVHVLIDDLDGTEAEETVKFAIDGVAYEIDLTGEHAAGMRAALAPFVGVAQRLGRVDSKGAKITRTGEASANFEANRARLDAVRMWFRKLTADQRAKLGLPESMSDRGRVPLRIVEAFGAVQTGFIQTKPTEAAEPTPEPVVVAPVAVEVEQPKPSPRKRAAAKPAPVKATPASGLEISPARRTTRAAKAATVTQIGSAKGARGAAGKPGKITPKAEFKAAQ